MLAPTVIEEARGELPPTATYSRRSWSWLAAPGSHLVSRDGTLSIMQTSGRRVLKTEVDHYAVQVERDEFLPEGVWAFLLENELDPDLYGPFRCVIAGSGGRCSCEAARAGLDCKHRAALAALVERGVFKNGEGH